MKRRNLGSGPAGVLLPQGSGRTITYEDVVVTKEKLALLKAEQDAAPATHAYFRFKAWLHYANLKRWQGEGHHFNYLSGDNAKHCTCGLVLNSGFVEGGVKAEFVGAAIVRALDGFALDSVQKVRGHKNLPSLQGNSVALIVDYAYREELKDHLWTAICQGCGEFLGLVSHGQAQDFVDRHNEICAQNISKNMEEQ